MLAEARHASQTPATHLAETTHPSQSPAAHLAEAGHASQRLQRLRGVRNACEAARRGRSCGPIRWSWSVTGVSARIR
jgi:hypothetical protein